ncbi:MAG: nicotinamide mononucleotide transporter [Clostridia bacterium]|nr:nicotinamide mononucleotide transporter [Clostridia bacterium]
MVEKRHNFSNNLIVAKVDATKGASSNATLYAKYGISSSRAIMVKHLYNSAKFTFWWYAIFTLLGVLCLALVPSSWISVVELFVCIISIELIGRAKLAGHYVGLVEVFLYAYISYNSGLYGEIFKSLAINLPITIFTIVSWTKNMKVGQSQGKLTIRKMGLKHYAIFGVMFVALAIASYFILNLFGTTALVLSAITLSMSIVCKFLNAFCFKEVWLMEIVKSLISISLWGNVFVIGLQSGDLSSLPMMVLYLAILSNAVYAYLLWKAMYKKVAVNGGKVFAMRKLKINRIVKLRHRFHNFKWDKQIDMQKNS